MQAERDLKTSGPPLNAPLEVALLDAIAEHWEVCNRDYFASKMKAPVFTLIDSKRLLGQWDPQTRTIAINRAMALEAAWRFVADTIAHEMAHQYVSEIEQVDEAPHGPAFARACARMGISARASSSLDPTEPSQHHASGDDATLKIIDKVKRLLALADSPNENEAKNAAAMAQRLMVKYNVERTRKDGHQDPSQRFGYLHLGTPTRRMQEHQRMIGAILATHFFVQVVFTYVFLPEIGKYARVIEIAGTQPNLIMARYVHDFLLQTAQELWTQHYKAQKLSSKRSRLTYMAGVMHGFATHLRGQRQELRREGLVPRPDGELEAFKDLRHPRLCTSRRQGRRRTADFAAGHKAGQRIVLRKPVEKQTHKSRNRALGSGS